MSRASGPWAMRCPICQQQWASAVIDSRVSADGTVTRRRRQCSQCQARFTTYESLVDPRPRAQAQIDIRLLTQRLRTIATALEATETYGKEIA